MENAPLFHDIANGPGGGVAHWVETTDGLRIRVGHWANDGAKGTVIIFPGRTEYIEKYGRTAQALQDRGFAVLAIDWRGQGLADRMMANRGIGHVGRFTDYQIDVSAVMAHAAALDLPKPWFMLAHSMGGCIGLRSLIEGLDVRAVMFSAPMWGINMSGALRPFAWGVSELSMRLRFDHLLVPGQSATSYLVDAVFAGNTLTNDETLFDAMRAQLLSQPDLALGGPSLRWFNEALRETRHLSRQSAPDVPCLTFLGGREAIVDPDRIQRRMAQWPGGQLRVIPDGQHEMLMDTPPTRERLFDETAAHFNAHM